MLTNENRQGADQKGATDISRQGHSHANSSPLSSISLPKGGGAIRGIGEKFAANPVTGTGSLTVPVYTSPGRSGFGPQLSLSYDSGASNGPFGFGWALALPSITRKTDKGLPQYVDAKESDTFILSGAEDLVPLLMENDGQWTRDILSPRTVYGQQYSVYPYRPRVEGLFARIERWVNLADPRDTFWRSITRDNITTWYGKTSESRIADPADPAHVFTWLICESYDDKGNVIVYQYKAENSDGVDLSQAHESNRSDTTRSANRYLKHVLYGNRAPYFPNLKAERPVALPTDSCFELVFDYGEHDESAPVPQETGAPWICRDDPFSSYRAAFEVRTYRLCRRALMFHHFADVPGVGLNCLVRSTDLTHAQPVQPPTDPTKPFYSFLLSVTQTGYRRVTDTTYLAKSLPPLEFTYTEAVIDETLREVDPVSLENLPNGLDGTTYRWVDLDGEGLSGILTEQTDGWYYKPNLSPANLYTENGVQSTLAQFGSVQLVARLPSLATPGNEQQLLDLAGDGHLDLVEFDSFTPGFFERTADEDWRPFTPFTSLPVLDWQNPNLKFVDLTGDGHADLLLSEDDAFWWHTSLATEGFGPAQRVQQALDEEKGPKLIFADSTESIFLADLSGDGLTDLVRVRNGETCYWPNLGYGNFGAKVTMDQAPWFEAADLFDGRRIQLADIDGSGTSDMIYCASGGVQLYFNQSGNAWGAIRALSQFPPVGSESTTAALDLLGIGTACLVWSSLLPGDTRQAMRYIDLMGGQKPHLLTGVINNLGAETRIQYAPSTRFYIADKLAGTPWLTRIPFPVHVVEQVQTFDYVSRNLFATRYAYHHGYYDGVEREFRGFGRVDQWDTEEIATLTESGAFPQPTNLDFQAPPVRTSTWFHTGAFFGEARVSKHFEQEYYREGDRSEALAGLTDLQAEAMLLDDTVLPATILLPDGTRLSYALTDEEAREACRALRGSILRQEVYALDGTDASDRPYSTSERNYTIEMLQPQDQNPYAVFFSHPRETINFHYERKLFQVVGNALVDPNAPPPNARPVADPRVSHALTLAVDTFGNVLQSVAVGYGRRYMDPTLTSADQTGQGTTLSTYTEHTYTNAVLEDDVYRTSLPAETSTFELIQFQPGGVQPDVTNLFRFSEIQAGVQTASDGQHDLPYEDLNATGLQAGQPYRRLIERGRTLYRPDDMGASVGEPRALLPLGGVEALALPGESYRLAFTPGLLSQVYQRNQVALIPDPASVLGGVGADGGGYVDLDGDGHWWLSSGRLFYLPAAATPQQERTEALQHFFLPRRFEDAFGNSGSVDYDTPHDLLAVQTVDAVANTVNSVNDYRVLLPSLVTDPNGNRAAVAFDALGMMVGSAVMGKTTETFGDLLDASFEPDPTQAQLDAFMVKPRAASANADESVPTQSVYDLLGSATTRVLYDPDRFKRVGEPPFAATLARETHVSDLQPGQQTGVQMTFSYSDGFGREIQKKIQAEPGTTSEGGPPVNPRWVGSGWTIFNNKGKPVRQYEPFFDDTHEFTFGNQVGVSSILFYDPVERVVATLHPNHTWDKVVFDPWRQESWDVNDTVLVADPKVDPDVVDFFRRLPDDDYLPGWYALRTDPAFAAQAAQLWPDPQIRAAETDAATKAAVHANTPTLAFLDTLGRPFLTLAHNRFERNGALVDEQYLTRTKLDIAGNRREVRDALDRAAMRYDHDLLGNPIHQASMEAGERWTLNDGSSKPLYAWDSQDHQFRTSYDPLRRPTESFLREGTGTEMLIGRVVYGETQPNPEAKNQRGKGIQVFDQAGMIRTEEYDFKGNLLTGQRQLAQEYKTTLDWSANPALEQETLTGSITYDAPNRPLTATTPDGSVYRPTFNEANLLERVDVNLRGTQASTPFVTNIDYDAKGQRTLIEYGSNIKTEYVYDPLTLRLSNLRTTRLTDQARLQDLSYAYDPAGNITHLQDDAQQTIYFRNRQVEPSTDYTYDAVYRLLSASGREHLGQASGGGSGLAPIALTYDDSPRMGILQPGDGNAMGSYLQQYTYDGVGNILQMQHSGTDPANPGWTRVYSYSEASLLETGKVSNRLSSTAVGGGSPEVYAYDEHGNMTSMPHLPLMQWDFKNQLHAVAQQIVNNGTPETTYYVYDAAGQRVRKVTERQNGTRKNERTYLGGFEVYREYDGNGTSVDLERETLHVMDDKQRIALVETRTQGDDGSPEQLIRYQFSNHLDSASLELDAAGQIIAYEEYYPYGSTSYQAGRSGVEASLKRYRYTGMERDEESGLNYHGARYYALWLGRWTSTDPVGIKGGMNLYRYTHNNPLGFIDPAGTEPLRPLGGPFATADHYKLPDTPDQKLPTRSEKNLTPVTVNNQDRHQTEQSTMDAVHSSMEYIDTGIFSVGAEIDNLVNLNIEALRYRYATKPDVVIPINAINFESHGTAVAFVKRNGVIYPLNANGEVALNDINTPNIVAGARMKLGDRANVLVEREEIGWAVYAFAGAIHRLGSYAAMMGQVNSAISSIVTRGSSPVSTGDEEEAGNSSSPNGYRIIDGTHRARAAVQLGINQLDAEVFEGDKLVNTTKVNVGELRSVKPIIDLSGKGMFRWMRALEEVATGKSGPIKITPLPGGTPIHQVKIVKPRD